MRVVRGLQQQVDDHLGDGRGVELAEGLADGPDRVELAGAEQKLLAARAGLVDVDGGEDPLLGQLAVEVDLHVARALEFLEDHLVHSGAGLDQRSGDDGETPSELDVAGRAEEALRPLQGARVETAGKGASGRLDGEVVCSRQSGHAVHEDHDVLAEFDEAHGPVEDQFCDLDVVVRGLVEGGVDDLAVDRALHVGDFFGALVDQKDDQLGFRVVDGDRVGDLLEENGLAGFRRRYDHSALTLADWSDEVDDPRRKLVADGLQTEFLVWIYRRQLVEVQPLQHGLRGLSIHFLDVEESLEAVALTLHLAGSGDEVAVAEVEAADVLRRHVDVPGTRQVVLAAEESVAVGHQLEHAFDDLAGLEGRAADAVLVLAAVLDAVLVIDGRNAVPVFIFEEIGNGRKHDAQVRVLRARIASFGPVQAVRAAPVLGSDGAVVGRAGAPVRRTGTAAHLSGTTEAAVGLLGTRPFAAIGLRGTDMRRAVGAVRNDRALASRSRNFLGRRRGGHGSGFGLGLHRRSRLRCRVGFRRCGLRGDDFGDGTVGAADARRLHRGDRHVRNGGLRNGDGHFGRGERGFDARFNGVLDRRGPLGSSSSAWAAPLFNRLDFDFDRRGGSGWQRNRHLDHHRGLLDAGRLRGLRRGGLGRSDRGGPRGRRSLGGGGFHPTRLLEQCDELRLGPSRGLFGSQQAGESGDDDQVFPAFQFESVVGHGYTSKSFGFIKIVPMARRSAK